MLWGISPPQKPHPPISYFLPTPPPSNLKSEKCPNPPPPPPPPLKSEKCPTPPPPPPLFRRFSPLYCFFHDPPPPPHSPLLKIRFFSEPEIYSSFSFLTPSNLLKITKFLVKVSQFEFFVMTEKNSFVSKLFLSLNISDIVYLLCKNCTPPPPPPIERAPPLSHQPPSKNYSPVKAPLFENFV